MRHYYLLEQFERYLTQKRYAFGTIYLYRRLARELKLDSYGPRPDWWRMPHPDSLGPREGAAMRHWKRFLEEQYGDGQKAKAERTSKAHPCAMGT